MFGTLLGKLFNRPLTEEGFVRQFIQAVRQAGYHDTLEYVPEEFRLLHGNGGYFNLHNAFRDYQRADKPKRTAVLNGYVATLLSTKDKAPQTFEQVRPTLRPVIRNLGMLDEVRLHHVRSEGWGAPYTVTQRPLGKDCVMLLAVDSPESTATLTKGPEEGWGVTLDEALAIAVQNLRETTPEAFEEIIPGLYLGRWGDGYDISRVLLPDVLQRAPIKGRPVFMIPSNDVLMVTGDKDEPGIGQMVEVAFKAMENGRAVSSQIYTYQDQHIVPFQAQDEALKARLATLEHLLLQGTYHTQKELLDKIHEEQQQDVFVASYMLYQQSENDGRTFSMCSWTQGVDSLLPKTDRVVLVEPQADGGARTQVFEWNELAPHVGALLTPADVYPPRYRTAGFPGSEQLKALTPLG
ncbi:DUF1444 family protein [Pseudomonas vanderleydeniana]|uniref:DUF1444 family protein n=1 Tax=Pseudomonas vanderleydeniana TaxID=2745495 RepID=A0A9E6TP85_9PSED|nr:DUF1444 family protein [Pseudomonas vanderleydeniana]QXI26188.1 DUF1444 family protein [Pseudomonas vanderleydeniana]